MKKKNVIFIILAFTMFVSGIIAGLMQETLIDFLIVYSLLCASCICGAIFGRLIYKD